eukprot:SAG22_NODE_842_length_6892_cov_10.369645_3_plen_254_part_00
MFVRGFQILFKFAGSLAIGSGRDKVMYFATGLLWLIGGTSTKVLHPSEAPGTVPYLSAVDNPGGGPHPVVGGTAVNKFSGFSDTGGQAIDSLSRRFGYINFAKLYKDQAIIDNPDDLDHDPVKAHRYVVADTTVANRLEHDKEVRAAGAVLRTELLARADPIATYVSDNYTKVAPEGFKQEHNRSLHSAPPRRRRRHSIHKHTHRLRLTTAFARTRDRGLLSEPFGFSAGSISPLLLEIPRQSPQNASRSAAC